MSGIEVGYTVRGAELLVSVAASAAVDLFVQVTAVDDRGCSARASRCLRRTEKCPTEVRHIPAWPVFRELQQLPPAAVASGLVAAQHGNLLAPSGGGRPGGGGKGGRAPRGCGC